MADRTLAQNPASNSSIVTDITEVFQVFMTDRTLGDSAQNPGLAPRSIRALAV